MYQAVKNIILKSVANDLFLLYHKVMVSLKKVSFIVEKKEIFTKRPSIFVLLFLKSKHAHQHLISDFQKQKLDFEKHQILFLLL